jgi:hypothetical protein
MRLTWMAGMAVMLHTNAAAADSLILRVYMQDSVNLDLRTLAEAQWVTSRIFGAAGIRVQWKVGDPHQNETAAIRIQLDTKAEPGLHTDTAGYAQPFARGTAIHVFCDRVLHTGPERLAPILLGHVMAHELGHVLEGVDRHSQTGVMKAHWTRDDYDDMLHHPLAFTPEDVKTIRQY